MEENKKFFEACARHDWTYMMSDDGRVYRAGLASENLLKADPGYSEEIYQAWSKYYFSGPAYSTPSAPKPIWEQYEKEPN